MHIVCTEYERDLRVPSETTRRTVLDALRTLKFTVDRSQGTSLVAHLGSRWLPRVGVGQRAVLARISVLDYGTASRVHVHLADAEHIVLALASFDQQLLIGRDRQHIGHLPELKKCSQPGVLSVDRIGGHPASRHPGVQRPPQHRDRLDWFGREDDVRWQARLRATLTVINPRLRQIQLPVQESAPAVSATALGTRRRGHAIDDSRRSAHNEPSAPASIRT